MTIVRDMDHVAKRAEQQEREGAREMRLRAEVRAVAGYEPTDLETSDSAEFVVADGSGTVSGWISESEATWCPDCQRHRISCAHSNGGDGQ